MALLARHLEQISLSADAIASLPFPQPKAFTNAMLSTLDITSLIRDTEPHERALFSVPPPPPPVSARTPYQPAAEKARERRKTVFAVAEGEVTGMAKGRGRAVKEVLGREMSSAVGREKVDLEVLLRGVEKLDEVYNGDGVRERVEGARRRWAAVRSQTRVLEERVKRQEEELEGLGGGSGGGGKAGGSGDWGGDDGSVITEEDLKREREEIRILEERKAELDEKVKAVERELGVLSR